MKSSIYSNIFIRIYGINLDRLRRFLLRIILRIENGGIYSETAREIYKFYHDVDVGMYTHGAFETNRLIPNHTRIGRYCSIAANVAIINRNHPLEFKSTHGFFFNPILGVCKTDPVESIPLEIGNDVWLGHGAIIQPNVRKIGDGAVIGAGAVVNKDVPPYAVVVGNPSRIVRYRFSKEVIEELLLSRWWEKSIEELKPNLREFQCFLNDSLEKVDEGE